ncbi:kinase-like domain-containing protein, partial [Mycena floridula]
GRCIRHDQFDSVYQALNVNTGLNIAVRCLRLEGLRQEQTAALVREIDMVENLSHPNIVKYQVIPKDNIVILESVAHDSLIENTKTFGSSGEPLVASYVVQILEGLCYLHRSQLGAHGNLTAANILTDTDGNIKLSEFGPFLNTLSTTPSRNMAGTADFSTPELQLRFASRKFDIWALGCTIIELLTLKPPLPEIDDEIWRKFLFLSLRYFLTSFSDMFDADSILGSCSDQLRDFLLQCFSKDPISRPIAEELCEHPWLQKYSDSRNLKVWLESFHCHIRLNFFPA